MFTKRSTFKQVKKLNIMVSNTALVDSVLWIFIGNGFSSLNAYRQSVCTILRSNLDTRTLIGLCIETEALMFMAENYWFNRYFCLWMFRNRFHVGTTVHTVRIFKVPSTPHAESHYQILVMALSEQSGDSQATWCCRGGPQMTSYLYIWFGNPNPNLFYLRTNNATKWQINQTTVDSHLHFTVDTIMFMYVNNLTGLWFSQVWSGEEYR